MQNSRMKGWLFVLGICVSPVYAGASGDLASKVWNHGSEDCASNHDPAIEVFEAATGTYILRQNKCVNFEAPFIYALFGKHTVFIQDTGATADPGRFPLYDTVQSLIAKRNGQALKILVTHSHGHGDHTAADPQFRGQPGVTLVEANAKAVREYFGFPDWPAGLAQIDLGGRTLKVIPAPGHQDAGVAVYDSQTGWLLTGDNLYPGRLYVKNWNEYRSSIQRLADFSKANPVSAALGTHIEMSGAGELYPPGSSFQPGEASLALTVKDLSELNERLQTAGEEPQEIVLAKAVVVPMGTLQRAVTGIMQGLKWLGVYRPD